MFHQLTTITNHTIIVPQVRCHILILLLMMLSSSPASPHSFLYQVPKGDLFTTFIPISRLQNTTSNCCNFILTLSSCFLVLHLSTTPTEEVKSVGTFPVILVKLATPPLPPYAKLNLGWKWVLFRPNVAGVGEWGKPLDEPKANQKIVIRSRVLCNNYLEGFFHTVPSSLGLHCLKLI